MTQSGKTSQMATLKPVEGLFRSLFEAAPQAGLVCSRAGLIVLANQRAEQLLGCPRAQLTGRPIEDFVLSDSESLWSRASVLPIPGGEEPVIEVHARR